MGAVHLDGLVEELRPWLEEAVVRHRVPGTVVGVLADGELVEAAAGVTNLRTGVPVTTDTLFLIGSISKLWTATLVMRLVDRGDVDLDDPVRRYLPDLRLSDEDAARELTVRHLLCHTSGIDENLLFDARDDDCIERFVAGLPELPQLHPPGLIYSYCNSGIMLAGRLVEVVTRETYDAALRRLLVEPLGLTHTVTSAEEAILHRAAVGHLADADGSPVVTPVWTLPRATGPAGGTICTTAADLLAFAKLHLDEGRAPNGEQLLAPELVREMTERQADYPDPAIGEAQGLGWRIHRIGGERAVGHWGGNIGQLCNLLVFPGRSFALAILSNAFRAAPLQAELTELVLDRALGLSAATPPIVDGPLPADLSRFAGSFASNVGCIDVRLRDGGLELESHAESNWVYELYADEHPSGSLEPVGGGAFELVASSLYGVERPRVMFLDPDGDGSPEYLHLTGYAYRRVA